MFESLTERFNAVFKKLKSHGKVTENDLKETLKEVRLTLLEADVHYKVVKQLTDSLWSKCLGKEVMESLTPAQQIIKILKEEMANLLGEKESPLNLKGTSPVSLMLVGLQGSGKTTTCAKLARWLKDKGRKPVLVSCDTFRPAAALQLAKLGEEIGVTVYKDVDQKGPQKIWEEAKEYAREMGCDTILVDTRGRWHIDEDLVDELKRLKEKFNPPEILLVVDAMTGQEAVNIATKFNEALDLTGIILTKLDGDARGGAAISMRACIQKPIKFVGVGEKIENLEIFYPERIASRILGMGDILSFIEKATTNALKETEELEKKDWSKKEFTLEDFAAQLKRIKKMGSLEEIFRMLPLPKGGILRDDLLSNNDFQRIEAIINSMTKEERLKPQIINGRRRLRVAKGSGTKVEDVNRMLKNFYETKKLLKNLQSKRIKGKSIFSSLGRMWG